MRVKTVSSDLEPASASRCSYAALEVFALDASVDNFALGKNTALCADDKIQDTLTTSVLPQTLNQKVTVKFSLQSSDNTFDSTFAMKFFGERRG